MEPANLNEPFCGLCLSTVRDTKYQKIDVVSDILEIVLPDMNLEEIEKHFVCEVCSVKLFAAFNFKSVCINTEDIIFPHINASKKSPVDLKEVYLKEKGSIQLNISEDQRICRLCFQLITFGFVSLNEVDVAIIDTYIPQVNVSATSHPVICGPCFDSLRTHGSFLENCLEAQGKYRSIDKQSYIKSKEIEINLEDDCQNVQEKFNSADNPFYIKSEEIEIKIEEDNENSGSSSYNLDTEAIENRQRYPSGDIGVATSEKSEFQNNDKLKYGTNNVQHENPSEIQMYKCDVCDYTTKYSWTLQVHQCSVQLHKDPAEDQMLMYYNSLGIKMWKCVICSFETKYKRCLKVHILRHKGGLDSRMYKCDVCNYKTKYENYLKRHQLLHKDSSEVQMYQCDTCSFQTELNSNLKLHQLRHKCLLKTQMYTCDMCTYKTKTKYVLNRHRSMRHNILEIQMWKCDMCSFQTRYKRSLQMHLLLHKDVRMYKCDTCTYETKFKIHLKTHRWRHKGLLESEIYKCDTCGYEADRKSRLYGHQLTHKDPSEIKMYKCDACPYEAKQKRYLKNHQLIHKDDSKVPMYQCDVCIFETKHKRYLKVHQLVHNAPMVGPK